MANWKPYAAALFAATGLGPLAVAQEQETIGPSEAVILEADVVYENTENDSVIAEGNVEVAYQGRVLRADRLVYNKTTDKVRANGNVVIIEADGSQQFADEIEIDSDLTDGYAIGYSARMPDGATVAANAAIRQDNGIDALEQVIYTACEICEENVTPTWSIRARRAVLDKESQMMSYRDAVIEVGGVPVLYLPFLAHPDPSSERRSGLLVPNGGLSSKLGAFYKQPYYWAISDSSDLTIAPLFSANVNPMIDLDYRKKFYSGAVNINTSFTHEADFDSEGERFGEEKFRGHIYGSGLFAINQNWKWGFGVERQTDDLYDRRYDLDGQSDRRGLYWNQPRRLLSQLFATGQGDSYYADIALLDFQGLRGIDDDAALPTAAPLFFGEKYFDFGDLGFASVNASTAFLTRASGVDSQRASLGAEWSDMNILPLGFTFEPFAEVRGDYYALDEDVSGEDSVSRVVGNVGGRIAYPMYRPGTSFDILIEPTVMAAWGLSNTNNTVLPIEDSLLYEYDESSLFEANGFGNYDLFEGDAKMAAGLSMRMLWKNGVDISSTVGRRWRARPDDSFNALSNLQGTQSDWVSTFSADFGTALRIDTRLRVDDEFNPNRIDLSFTSNYKRLRTVGQYYKIDSRISPTAVDDEGFLVRGELKVTDRYSVIFGQLTDVTNNLNAKRELGVAYEDDCSRFELVYTRSEISDRTLGPSENFQFRFRLKTVGQFGSNEFD
ncbi:MAG: LPS-assembly protein LptD [Hyphomonas sp.]